jgi:hypothetical protein
MRSNRHTFANHVATDGMSLCVHYRISGEAPAKRECAKKCKRGADDKPRGPFEGYDKHTDERGAPYRVLGHDPGRSNLSFMAEVLPDGSFRLTRGAYYDRSGTNANATLCQKCLERFNDSWSRRTSPKTVWLSDILENARQVGGTLEQ